MTAQLVAHTGNWTYALCVPLVFCVIGIVLICLLRFPAQRA